MPDENFTDIEKDIAKKVWGKAITKAVKQKKSDGDEVNNVSYYENDSYIIEQIKLATSATDATHAADTAFTIYNKETGETDTINEYIDPDRPGEIFKPIQDDLLRTGTVSLPSGVEEYGTTEELVKEIQSFLFKYFELPGFFEKFMPYLVLFYWVYEKFPFVPYLHFVGRTSTGKSTAMEVIGSICYKPIDASGAITMASIFRVASTWRGTLLLDEFTSGGENYHEMISFLKSGVSNKAVLRVEGEKEKSVRAYIIKSPKMFTSEDPITDAGLQSRTMVIRMQKNKRRVPLYRLKEYEEQAISLRNKLLLYRFRNLNKINLTEIKFGFEALAHLDRRVQQVVTPIYYLSNDETKGEILKFAREQQDETLRERREALPGQIFQLIMDNYPGETALKYITAEVNKEKGGDREYTEKRIASVIRKVLGLGIHRSGHENVRVVEVTDNDKLEELSEYYGTVLGDSDNKTLDGVEQVAQVAQVATEATEDADTTANQSQMDT
jgi:hypothetical protein